jgi:hypothetical protein
MNEFQVRDAMLRGADRAVRLTREQLFGDTGYDVDDVASLAIACRFHAVLRERLDDVERNINHYALTNAKSETVINTITFAK